jgi:hypothetical protein
VKRIFPALVLIVTCLNTWAAEKPEKTEEGDVGRRLSRYCDPVCQLRTQDAAFALLLETYREFVAALDGKEKELREARLQVQVENLRTAYNCIRQCDEEKAGQKVPSQVNTREAADRLKEFVIVKPGSAVSADRKNPTSVPAVAVLLDAPKRHLPEGQTVGPCSPGDPITEFNTPDRAEPDVTF